MNKKNTYLSCIIVGTGLCITAVVLLLSFLLSGERVVGGQYPEPFRADSISCTKENEKYPFFRYDESKSKRTEILSAFNDNGVERISLRHTLYYSDPEQIMVSIAHNQAALNLDFQNEGLGNRALNASYSDGGDKMTLVLYEDGANLSSHKLKYFLLDNVIDFSASGIEKYLTDRGFTCKKY